MTQMQRICTDKFQSAVICWIRIIRVLFFSWNTDDTDATDLHGFLSAMIRYIRIIRVLYFFMEHG